MSRFGPSGGAGPSGIVGRACEQEEQGPEAQAVFRKEVAVAGFGGAAAARELERVLPKQSARLQMVKNTAYAWRQALFFLLAIVVPCALLIVLTKSAGEPACRGEVSSVAFIAALSKVEFGEGSQVNIPIAVLIWLMIYPMMLKVEPSCLKDVGRKPKGLVLTLVVNWLIKPFTMAALGVVQMAMSDGLEENVANRTAIGNGELKRRREASVGVSKNDVERGASEGGQIGDAVVSLQRQGD